MTVRARLAAGHNLAEGSRQLAERRLFTERLRARARRATLRYGKESGVKVSNCSGLCP